MKKLLTLAFTLVVIACSVTTQAAERSLNSPIGYWKTIDDVTGKPKSIVAIYEAPDHTLTGKVLKLFSEPDRLCTACGGELRDKPIVGMVVINNLKQSEKRLAEWGNGSILDPKNGKSYQCTLKVSEGGQKLNVRGFIGLPLFGRSQTWERLPEG